MGPDSDRGRQGSRVNRLKALDPLRLIGQSVAEDDPDRKAISRYGLYVPELEKV